MIVVVSHIVVKEKNVTDKMDENNSETDDEGIW